MDPEYIASAERIVARLEISNVSFADRKLFILRVAECLKASHDEVKYISSSSSISESDALDLVARRVSQVKQQPCIIQAAIGNNLPKFNNTPGRGHGYNGLGSFPAKTDCLTAGIPVTESRVDPRTLPKAFASEPILSHPSVTDPQQAGHHIHF